MILIFSEQNDLSTEEVISWLIYYKQNYIRINIEDTENIFIRVSPNDFSFTSINLCDQEINLSEIKAVWYRRGGISSERLGYGLSEISNNAKFNSYVKNERKTLIDFFAFQFKPTIKLGEFHKYSLNKIYCLNIAQKAGLDIPATIITTRKNDIVEMKKEYPNLIIKSIQDGLHFVQDNIEYHMYTEKVDDLFISKLANKFFPTCFQEEINKKFEIRTFYLDGKCYSMAILSQADKQTETDFRKYNDTKPNRTVPFKLPKEIENKLHDFMLQVGLNCGSFDIVYSTNKKFYFLEINPVGQYGMVSYPCNYMLDKQISKFLSDVRKQ